jgi:hypothetical protein
MRHPLVLGDDHRIAHAGVAEVLIDRMGLRLFHEPRHALAVLG